MTRGEAVNWIINITADIGKAEHCELWHYEQALSEIREMLESDPERKKGKWIETDDGWDGTYYVCSVCKCPWVITIEGNPMDNEMHYCPFCGADMRGEDDGGRES